MASGRGFRRHRPSRPRVNLGDGGREVLEAIDESSAVIKQFRLYSQELDAKHDRYERIVKISRDITIESKRIIFLLHTIDKESKRDAVLAEAEGRIRGLTLSLFRRIAEELEGQDHWQYIRAYRAGLQEFIEAVTFYHYLQDISLPHWRLLSQSFTYKIPLKEKKQPTKPEEEIEADSKEETPKNPQEAPKNPEELKTDEIPPDSLKKSDEEIKNPEETAEEKFKTLRTLLPPTDYILGVADLTGELMRKCINNLATGDVASCYQTCQVVRQMYKGFLLCNGISNKEISRKVFTLKQSLGKIENVCYMIKVRGEEIPKHMLADVAINASEDYTADDDEGFQGF